MNYLEVKFTYNSTEVNGDILLAELTQIPFESFVENEVEIIGYILLDLWDKQALEELPYLQENQVEVTINEIEQVNWNEEWEKNFDPILISNDCVIRADFHNLEKTYKFDIRINPKMSFGTGHHETTSLVLTEMLNIDFVNTKVLDMGTGTGVLAILAAMKGAKNVLAIDNDEWAYKNSIENVELNHYLGKIDVVEGSIQSMGDNKFNVILANINKNIIKVQMESYASGLLPNARLLISGILVEDCDEIIGLASKCGLMKIEQKQKNKWSLLVFSN